MKRMTKRKLEKILVIEDTPSHLEDAKKFFESIGGLKTEYATTFYEAVGDGITRKGKLVEHTYDENLRSVRKPIVDGVITDLFFPVDDNIRREINEGPNGLLVAITCQSVDVPYVICTAGFHHGDRYEWANFMHRTIWTNSVSRPVGHLDMIDHYDEYNRNVETEHKDWKKAYEALKELVENPKRGD